MLEERVAELGIKLKQGVYTEADLEEIRNLADNDGDYKVNVVEIANSLGFGVRTMTETCNNVDGHASKHKLFLESEYDTKSGMLLVINSDLTYEKKREATANLILSYFKNYDTIKDKEYDLEYRLGTEEDLMLELVVDFLIPMNRLKSILNQGSLIDGTKAWRIKHIARVFEVSELYACEAYSKYLRLS